MPTWREALTMMEGLGFELTGLFPVARDDRLRIIELDAVLARFDGSAAARSAAPAPSAQG
jgi:hypothetical protein